jgi:hypothetical protein
MIGVSQISVAAYRGGGAAAPVNLDFVSTWDTTQAGSLQVILLFFRY